MSYREFAPPPNWADLIECVWVHTHAGQQLGKDSEQPKQLESTSNEHTVLPDGAMDVIATFHADGDLDEAFVVGAMTRPQVATLDDSSLVGIRFRPGAGGAALRTNAALLTDELCALSDVMPSSSAGAVADALRSLHAAPGSAWAIHDLAMALRMRHQFVPALVREAACELANLSSPVRVDAVAKSLRVSRQHLTRTFAAHSGLTPKQFAQICRVRALLAVARERASRARHATSASKPSRFNAEGVSGWSALALEFGYSDQSHLIADVRAVTGLTPGIWLASGSILPIAPVALATV
jgi:AraC-like DNA-binding protein